MHAVVLFGLALVASASAFVQVTTSYHEDIGIPLAEKIRAREAQIFSGRRMDDPLDERIVGGAVAPANAHPYLAGLLISMVGISGNSVCGASLVSGNRLVTAAHCWTHGNVHAWQFVVVLGSSYLFQGGTRIATSNVILHPQYDGPTLNNDVAMIYLPTSVFFTASIQPISLPFGSDSFVGNWAVAAGFGRTSDQQAGASSVISHVTVQVISVAQCQAIFGSTFVQPSTLCTNGAGGVGICGGDSGGPLALNINNRPTLIGISSFVASAGCQLGFPSAFARTTSYIGFINQHMN